MIETDTSLSSGIKLKCSRERLVETVALVARAVSARTSVQVLAGILLRAEKGRLHLAATDMELSITSSLEADVEGEGESVVPGRVFVDACRSLPVNEADVTIEQASGSRMVSLTCGGASYRLNVSTPEDFPRLPKMTEEGVFKVNRDTFLDTVGRVARAASRDESRPVLTGILVQFEKGTSSSSRRLLMAATDSYRLAVKETEFDGDTPELEAIVPARAMTELARIAGVRRRARARDTGQSRDLRAWRYDSEQSPDRWTVSEPPPASSRELRRTLSSWRDRSSSMLCGALR